MPELQRTPERFSTAEYQRRLRQTRAHMEKQDLDLLIVSDPSNMAWLTGYDGWSFYVHQCVIVGPTGDPVWFGRGQDANGALRTVWMVLVLLMSVAFLVGDSYNPFLYFRF